MNYRDIEPGREYFVRRRFKRAYGLPASAPLYRAKVVTVNSRHAVIEREEWFAPRNASTADIFNGTVKRERRAVCSEVSTADIVRLVNAPVQPALI